jgi:hypothetical protein
MPQIMAGPDAGSLPVVPAPGPAPDRLLPVPQPLPGQPAVPAAPPAPAAPSSRSR